MSLISVADVIVNERHRLVPVTFTGSLGHMQIKSAAIADPVEPIERSSSLSGNLDVTDRFI